VDTLNCLHVCKQFKVDSLRPTLSTCVDSVGCASDSCLMCDYVHIINFRIVIIVYFYGKQNPTCISHMLFQFFPSVFENRLAHSRLKTYGYKLYVEHPAITEIIFYTAVSNHDTLNDLPFYDSVYSLFCCCYY